MENRNKAQKRPSKALFLLLGVIPFLLLSCASGKSVQNNAISQHYEKSAQKDSSDTNKSKDVRTYMHDSIFVQDSIVVLMRGDTVYRDRWHLRTITKTKEVQCADTFQVYKLVTDTVKVGDVKYKTNTVYKTVEKPMSGFKYFRLVMGDIFIFLLLLYLMCVLKEKFGSKNS